VVERLTELVAAARPELDVVAAYLDHGAPRLHDLDSRGAVVVPLLLAAGFHATTDITRAAPRAKVAGPLGPDPRLTAIVADRLRTAGWQGETPLVLAAAGSAEAQALDDVRVAAAQLAELLDVTVTAAFVAAGLPQLADLDARAVASYVLAPGIFADRIAAHPAAVTSAPFGADPRIAAVILDRYDAVVREG
jgi:sirohydrochlorin ferrochelatase